MGEEQEIFAVRYVGDTAYLVTFRRVDPFHVVDVSDPTDPTIADSKVYERDWSRVSNTHHAFTIDRRHGVFFLPAGEEGLVVNYANESLAVETTVDVGGAVRARYVGDYLYVFGRSEIAVVDETTWERTATVELGG